MRGNKTQHIKEETHDFTRKHLTRKNHKENTQARQMILRSPLS